MVLLVGMEPDTQDRPLSPFVTAVNAFLRTHIDKIDVETISGSDFSTLLDLSKSVDAVVARGMEKWRGGKMS